MTTPTAESMKKAHSLLIEGESVADQVEAIALALDNAHEAGLREAVGHLRAMVRASVCWDFSVGVGLAADALESRIVPTHS